ncbi:SDR family NAD(P)-dependent oxidoreductase [Dactylosporangium sp. CA-092794]|uniref:SDR family NAD(P)-dependent oxidoreductase n=1 Tax=Dactylosporangium sp. CA-092794 TaxID=3239929 RepID=UPI003D945045
MQLGLEGRTIVVTGGASNIGRATSLTLAKEGANVVIADLDVDQANRVAKESTGPGPIAVCETDVTSLESVQALAAFTAREFGTTFGLANVVGWEDVHKFVDTTPEFWQKVTAINWTGVLNTTYAFLPQMIEAGTGVLLHVASDAGRIGEYKEAVYGGCKAAVINFSKTIAREVGPLGIRSNVVCPGMTMPTSEAEYGALSMHATTTKIGSAISPETLERAKRLYPLRKFGTGQDLANSIAFLLSHEAAGHITGQTLSVSGGYTMI